MKGYLQLSAFCYAVSITMGAATIASDDAGFAVMGLLYSALGLGWLDMAFTVRERGR